MRIGLFGGTFDPVHFGHLNIAQRAAEQLGLDRVYWIPAHLPPHKKIDVISPPAETRARMVEAAVTETDNPRFAVLDCEITRAGTSYSIDTIREVRRLHSDAKIFFIVGADAFALVPSWREADEVIASVTFAVHARPGDIISTEALHKIKSVTVDGPLIAASSSEIRNRLYQCRDVGYLVPDSVMEIIEDQVLYISEISQGMRQHIAAVEAAAVVLAERWGLSRKLLSKAARYHDAYRTISLSVAESILREVGETVDDDERAAPNLLHGRVAAARMEANRMGRNHSSDAGASSASSVQTDGWIDCVNAVRYHTTGRAGMSAIEETLFAADRIEKDWDHIDAVPHERRTAVVDALKRKLAWISYKGQKPHPRMLDAARFYGVVA